MTPKIDIEILPTYDVRVLRIADISEWEHLITESSYIDIKLPAKKNPTTLYFQKNRINTFNSANLEISTSSLESLPDGLYTIRVYICEGCKFYKEVKYLRTVKALLDLDEILISLHKECCGIDDNLLNEYLRIEILLKSAHANIRKGNFSQGMCEYEQAIELIENYKQNK